ncbi:MAG: hypothetical protein Q4P24_07730 [Rhodobacterales bacterium]|nr:hypothetical protein [Rhodobacterales bacterium]
MVNTFFTKFAHHGPMRRALAMILVLCPLAAGPAQAGAWLRAEGEGFTSWSVKVQDDAATRGYSTAYLEYGLNPDLTGGLDIGGNELGEHKALAFVLMPIRRDDLHVSFQLGAGVISGEAAMRPGVSIGKGLKLGALDGWGNIDIRSDVTGSGTYLSIDTTLGVNVSKRAKLIGQLQQGGPLTSPDYMRAFASVVWQFAPGRHIELGATTSVINSESFGLQIGFWNSF